MPAWAGGAHALVQLVVAVLPDGCLAFPQVLLVFADEVARFVEEPRQLGVGVGGLGQLAAGVVAEGLHALAAAGAGLAPGEAAHGVEFQLRGGLAFDHLGEHPPDATRAAFAAPCRQMRRDYCTTRKPDSSRSAISASSAAELDTLPSMFSIRASNSS